MPTKQLTIQVAGTLTLLITLLMILNPEAGFTQDDPPLPNIIGNRVWCDDNADGMLSGGERIADVRVEITGQSTAFTDSAVTDIEGNYLFSSLPRDTYIIEVITSTLPSTCNQPIKDADGGNDNMSTVTFDVNHSEYQDQDFGYAPPPGIVPGTGQIGNRVWCDADLSDDVTNVNMIAEKIAGVEIMITNARGYTTTTTTDAGGNYLFDQIGRGPYTVEVMTATLPLACSTPIFDFDGGADSKSSLVLADGQSDLNHDFGYKPVAPLGTVGNKVWCDLDGDVTQDAGEGMGNVIVNLQDTVNNLSYNTITLGGGSFLISNLPASTYMMSVDAASLPATCNAILTDPDSTPNGSTTFALAEGEINFDKDFGYSGTLPVADIGGQVWCDENESGLFDAGEGIAALPVNLIDGSAGVFTVNTDADGKYVFVNRTADTYTIRVNPGNLPPACSQPSMDPDGEADNQTITIFEPTSDLLTLDFVYVVPAVEPTPTNTPMPTAVVTAEPTAVVTAEPTAVVTAEPTAVVTAEPTAVVTAEPTAVVTAEPTAVVTAEPTAVVTAEPTAVVTAEPTAVVTAEPTAVVTAEPTAVVTAEPTETPVPSTTGTITGSVWDDANGNGSQDSGEAGLAGIRVELYDSTGMIIAPALTGTDGSYTIPNVPAGQYYIKIMLDDGDSYSELFSISAGESKSLIGLSVNNVAPIGQDDTTNLFLPLIQ